MTLSRLTSALSALNSVNTTSTRMNSTDKKVDTHLTEEQINIINDSSKILKVQAFAGTGKTTTLQALAKQTRRGKGLYLAFNRSIAQHAANNFPTNVDCFTHNAAALRALTHDNQQWKNTSKHKLRNLEKTDILKAIVDFSHLQINPTILLKTILKYIYSSSEHIEEGMVLNSILDSSLPAESHDINQYIKIAYFLWNQMSDPTSEFPMPHDGYLKLWSLNPKQFKYDYIMIDEAQDSNPSFLFALEQMKARKIFVGDEHQGIYSFRGTINALRELKGAEEKTLSITHRFGPKLSDIANHIISLKNLDLKIKSSDRAFDTIVMNNHTPLGINPLILARTNSGLFQKAFDLANQGKKFSFIGNAKLRFDDLEDLSLLSTEQKGGLYDDYKNIDALIDHAKENQNTDLILRAQIAKTHKNGLRSAIDKINSASVETHKNHPTLSTVHQAKGLEAEWVELLNDFPELPTQIHSQDFKAIEEANILYVAVTRAKIGINVGHKKMFTSRLDKIDSKKEQDIQLF